MVPALSQSDCRPLTSSEDWHTANSQDSGPHFFRQEAKIFKTADEAILNSLGKGQHRLHLELAAAREDIAQLRLLLTPHRSAWWRELTGTEGNRRRRPNPEGNAEQCGGNAGDVDNEEEAEKMEAEARRKALRLSRKKTMGRTSELNAFSCAYVPPYAPLPPSLPERWPAVVPGRAVALGATSEASFLRQQRTVSLQRADQEALMALSWQGLDPDGNVSLCIAAVTLLVLCHDTFMIPFVLAWELPLEGPVLISTCFSCVYWTMDMLLGFVTGYHKKGNELELRIGRLARHYAATWFLPDLFVVLADWCSLLFALGGSGAPGSLLRFAKLGKFARLMGLLRMMKVVKVFEDFIANCLNELTRMSLWLFRFFLGILWLCHLICCAWFAVGSVSSDTGMRWTDSTTQLGMQELPYLEAPLLYQYVTALHWSLAKFTLGDIEIDCYNSWERLFDMLCIFVGLIGGSVIVGTFSATMVDYQMVRKENAQKLQKLRRYLRENRSLISKSTAKQLQQQAVERLKLKEKLQERDVAVLGVVSSALRSELRFETMSPLLNTHGLFQLWATLDRITTRRVCTEALEYRHYRPQDEIFLAGTATDTAHHVASGNVRYLKDPETAPVLDPEVHPVASGAWMAEAGLWAQWVHVGTAQTVGHCEVLSVSAGAVDMMVEHHPQVGSITKHYAKKFFSALLAASPPASPYPDDLEVPHTHFDEIVMSCQPSVQRAVSLHLLTHASGRLGAFKELKEEVSQGKSCVLLDSASRVQRLVSVVVLELFDSDGRVMVELAKREDESEAFKASCQLPAKKQSHGEVSAETLQRMLDKLGASQELPFEGPDRQVREGYSDQFGVETKYLRKVYTAVCEETVHVGREVPKVSLKGVDEEAGPCLTGSGEGTRLADLSVIMDMEKRSVLAWLPPQLFEELRTAAGKQALTSWVEALNEATAVSQHGITATPPGGPLPDALDC